MNNLFTGLVIAAVLLFVWYDGVKHGYKMATEDFAAAASTSAGTARESYQLQRL